MEIFSIVRKLEGLKNNVKEINGTDMDKSLKQSWIRDEQKKKKMSGFKLKVQQQTRIQTLCELFSIL